MHDIQVMQPTQSPDFTTLFDLLPVGAYRSTPDGRQLRANAALVRLNGYDSERQMLDAVKDIGNEWYVEAGRRDEFRRLLERDGKVLGFESEIYRHKTRERIWIRENAHVLRDASGRISYYEGTVEDITERRAAEEELRRGHLVMQATQELARIGGVETDLRTGTVTLTDQVYHILEIDRTQHKPSLATVLDFFAPESKPVIRAAIDNSNKTGSTYDLELEMITATGRRIWVHTKNVITMENGQVVRRTALLQDITERKRAELVIWEQANFDALTGLPNRRMLRDRLGQDLLKSRRMKNLLAVLYVGIDHFKGVNDALGHVQGDALLKEAAQRIKGCVRATDTVARMGGDEFTIVLNSLADPSAAATVAQDVIAAMNQAFELSGERIFVSASVGVTLYPEDATGADELLRQADQALFEAKSQGRGRFAYFTSDMQEAAQTRMRLASELRSAIANNELFAVYQPIVDMATGRIFKAEALVRWQHPTRGLVSPGLFIPVAEGTGQIVALGEWMFREVARQVKVWRETIDPNFQITINKSPAQFRSGAPAQQEWFDRLADMGLSGDSIVVEITEGLLLDQHASVTERLLELRDAGVQVALDDFGTGYSSLAYLQRFDIDFLKIDQSFVRGLTEGSRNHALCKAIIVMAHELGMRVVAEGIETAEQHRLLKAAGCDFAQGYHLGRPVRAAEFSAAVQPTPVAGG